MSKIPMDYSEEAYSSPKKPKDTGSATPLKVPKPKSDDIAWHGFRKPQKK